MNPAVLSNLKCLFLIYSLLLQEVRPECSIEFLEVWSPPLVELALSVLKPWIYRTCPSSFQPIDLAVDRVLHSSFCMVSTTLPALNGHWEFPSLCTFLIHPPSWTGREQTMPSIFSLCQQGSCSWGSSPTCLSSTFKVFWGTFTVTLIHSLAFHIFHLSKNIKNQSWLAATNHLHPTQDTDGIPVSQLVFATAALARCLLFVYVLVLPGFVCSSGSWPRSGEFTVLGVEGTEKLQSLTRLSVVMGHTEDVSPSNSKTS